MRGTAAVQVILDPASEVLDGQERFEILLAAFEPGPRPLGGLAQGLRQGLDQLVGIEAIAVAFRLPIAIGNGAERGLEGVELALSREVPLQVGDVRMVPAEAELLVEHLEEDPQDGVAPAGGVGLAVDVEQADIDGGADGALDVGGQHGVLDLAVEEIDGAPGLSGVADNEVLQQVGEDLEEVRLAGAEEPRDPDPDHADDLGVPGVVDRIQVGAEEAAAVDVEFLGNDVLVELLPDRRTVGLIGLDDAVDGTVDRLGEKVLNQHHLNSWRGRLIHRWHRQEINDRLLTTETALFSSSVSSVSSVDHSLFGGPEELSTDDTDEHR